MQLRSRNNACVQRQPVGLLHCRIRWLSCSASVHHWWSTMHLFLHGEWRPDSCKTSIVVTTDMNIYYNDWLVFTISFAGTGLVAVIIAWFILPEVTRRTPAEIDEMYVAPCQYLINWYGWSVLLNRLNWTYRFEKRVDLRKFKGYITEVQMRSHEQLNNHEMVTRA